MAIPLAEVMRRIESATALRKSIGREAMIERCLSCVMAVCNPKIAGCLALQYKNERQRARYAANKPRRRAQSRRYYRKNKVAMRARSAAYQRDPVTLAVMAAKRRLRYAERKAAQGKPVRAYQWSNPHKNKSGHQATTQESPCF